jgi:hypothetical protein
MLVLLLVVLLLLVKNLIGINFILILAMYGLMVELLLVFLLLLLILVATLFFYNVMEKQKKLLLVKLIGILSVVKVKLFLKFLYLTKMLTAMVPANELFNFIPQCMQRVRVLITVMLIIKLWIRMN